MSANDVVTLTERAASELRRTVAMANGHTVSVRIAVVRTHCMGGRGFTYRLAADAVPSRDDEVVEDGGLRICVDRVSSGYLKGARLDYVDTVDGVGFRVDNPNAIARCPCGHHDLFE